MLSEKLKSFGLGGQDSQFISELVQREMRNYVRYLDVLRASHDASVTVESEILGPELLRWVPIEDTDQVTLARIQRVIDSIER